MISSAVSAPFPSPTLRLDDHGDALPAADARRADRLLAAAAAQLVEQVGDDPRARRAERMAKGDRTPVDIRARAIEPELLLDRQVLGGERLVHLDQVVVGELAAGALERAPDRRGRADAHDLRVAAGDAPVDQAAERLPP